MANNIEDDFIAKLSEAGVAFDAAVKWVHDHTGVDSATHIASGLTNFDKLVSDLKGGIDGVADVVDDTWIKLKADVDALIGDVSGGVMNTEKILAVLKDLTKNL